MKDNINGMVITVNGKQYRLVEIESESKTNNEKVNAIVIAKASFGEVAQIHPLHTEEGDFPIQEGKYNHQGTEFEVRYMTEAETEAYKRKCEESRMALPPEVRLMADIVTHRFDGEHNVE